MHIWRNTVIDWLINFPRLNLSSLNLNFDLTEIKPVPTQRSTPLFCPRLCQQSLITFQVLFSISYMWTHRIRPTVSQFQKASISSTASVSVGHGMPVCKTWMCCVKQVLIQIRQNIYRNWLSRSRMRCCGSSKSWGCHPYIYYYHNGKEDHWHSHVLKKP